MKTLNLMKINLFKYLFIKKNDFFSNWQFFQMFDAFFKKKKWEETPQFETDLSCTHLMDKENYCQLNRDKTAVQIFS